MGDRADVIIEDTGVILYTHWGAEEVVEDVTEALRRGDERWNDPPYLARIIFDDMKGDERGTNYFGIGTTRTHVRRVVRVNCDDQTVTLEEWDDEQWTKSFEELTGLTPEAVGGSQE